MRLKRRMNIDNYNFEQKTVSVQPHSSKTYQFTYIQHREEYLEIHPNVMRPHLRRKISNDEFYITVYTILIQFMLLYMEPRHRYLYRQIRLFSFGEKNSSQNIWSCPLSVTIDFIRCTISFVQSFQRNILSRLLKANIDIVRSMYSFMLISTFNKR